MIDAGKLLVVCSVVASFCVPSDAWSDERVHLTRYDINANGGKNWQAKGSAKPAKNLVSFTKSTWDFGSIWHKEAVNFSNWELELDFELMRSNALIPVHADGFGIFYVQDPALGKTFGTIPGFVGLGIVLDTFRNGVEKTPKMPLLQAHVLDGSRPHDWAADGIPSALVNIHVPIVEKPKSNLRVRYQNNALKVTLKYKEGKATEWTKEEFKVFGVHLPRGYYFGLGASCGLFCSDHRVLGMKVYSLDGPDHDFEGLPRVDSGSLFQNNNFVLWSSFGAKSSPSAVVLDHTTSAQPVFFARIVEKGQLVPALCLPHLSDKLFAFANDQVTPMDRKGAQILSYRYSRNSHLLWQPYPTQRLESEEFRNRLVPVGYSNEGDAFMVCRSIPPETDGLTKDTVAPSGLGVFTISSGVCRYVSQIDSTKFQVLTTTKFSMLYTLPSESA